MARQQGGSHPQRINLLMFVLFFFSGAFALIYEVSWVRAITLELGSTTLAVSTVLAVFMGGLAFGASLSRRWVDELRSPLKIYALLEIGIGLYALLTPFIFDGLLPMFSIFSAKFANSFWFISGLRMLACILLLLLPTVLMGATLPVLSRFYAMLNRDSARGCGLLYGINTIGAFVGTLSAGFILLPYLGLLWTLLLSAFSNLILGVVAYVVARSFQHRPQHATAAQKAQPWNVEYVKSAQPVLLAIALTGCAAMACEVIWTRVLILIIGGSVYAFSTVLSTFLLGLGLGAAATAAVLRAEKKKAVAVFYGLSLAAAISVELTSSLFPKLPGLFLNLFWTWNLVKNPDKIFYLQVLLSISVMFVPAFIMGGLFPSAARILVKDAKTTGTNVACLYTWNTVGAIIGSILSGFLLIPLLGIRHALLLVILGYLCAAGISTFSKKTGKELVFPIASAAVIAVLLTTLLPPWHQQLMTSAMYNYAYHLPKMSSDALAATLRERQLLLFYQDGLSAVVTVTRSTRSQSLGITINGKYDGSSSRDMANQRLLAHAPLLLHPDPQNVCVIGMGTGCTAGSATLYPVKQVDVVEIESAVVEGAKFFREDNHRIHENPKADIHVTDGRLFLRLHPGAFDVIISEPSNPWLAGPSDLFTHEFFEFAAQALRQDGMFCQWVQLYALSPENLQTIIRTFTDVFPYTFLISSRPDVDLILLGAVQPIRPDIERVFDRMQMQVIRTDLADPRVNVCDIYDFAARIRMGPNELFKLAGSGALNTDDHPIVAYRAPKDLYLRTVEDNMAMIASLAVGIAPYLKESPLPGQDHRTFFMRLTAAYQKFLPGGREAQVSQQIAQDLYDDTNARAGNGVP